MDCKLGRYINHRTSQSLSTLSHVQVLHLHYSLAFDLSNNFKIFVNKPLIGKKKNLMDAVVMGTPVYD